MKAIILGTAFVLAAATTSFACTTEEAVAKATEVSQKIQELVAKDPQKASNIMEKISAAQTQAVTDLDAACKFYDAVLEELE